MTRRLLVKQRYCVEIKLPARWGGHTANGFRIEGDLYAGRAGPRAAVDPADQDNTMKHSSRRTCQLSDMDVSDIDEIVKVRK
jgi:hypothetical protein